MIVGICLVVEKAAQAESGLVSEEKVTPVFFPKSRRCTVTPNEILSQI